MKFSIALPNAIEGMAIPIPFANHTGFDRHYRIMRGAWIRRRLVL